MVDPASRHVNVVRPKEWTATESANAIVRELCAGEISKANNDDKQANITLKGWPRKKEKEQGNQNRTALGIPGYR